MACRSIRIGDLGYGIRERQDASVKVKDEVVVEVL